MADETIVRTIKIDVEGANKSLASVDKAQSKVTESTAKLDSQMAALPGPLGRAQGAVAALSKGFKALLANPIVLLIAGIVAGLVALGKAFSKTQEGADKIKNVMSGLSAIMEVLTERAAKLFKALGQILRGNFKEGFDEMKGAVAGVGVEMAQAARDAIALTEAYRALYLAETSLITANAERQRQIAELRFAVRDLTLSVNERRDAIVKADAIEKEILAENLRLQEMRVANAKQEIANTPELQRTREQLRTVAEEEAKLIQLQTQSLMAQRKLKTELNALDNEVAATQAATAKEEADRQAAKAEMEAASLEEKKALQAEADAAEKERLDALAEADRLRIESLEAYKRNERQLTHEGRLENLRAELEAEAILEEEYSLRLRDLELQNAEEIEAIKAEKIQATREAEKKLQADREQYARDQVAMEERIGSVKEKIYQDSLNALVSFLGEGSKAAKAVAIADATKSAIQGAISTYTSVSAIPVVGPVLGVVAAAAALAVGLANVRKIATAPDPKLPGGKGAGGGGSVPSVTLAAPELNLGVDDIVQTDVGIGQDVNIIQDRTSRNSVKAYVVESEVTSASDMARQREQEVEL